MASKGENRQAVKVGERASVVLDCGTVFGTGEVTHVAERTEVIFDDGSGGMFPNRFVRPIGDGEQPEGE